MSYALVASHARLVLLLLGTAGIALLILALWRWTRQPRSVRTNVLTGGVAGVGIFLELAAATGLVLSAGHLHPDLVAAFGLGFFGAALVLGAAWTLRRMPAAWQSGIGIVLGTSGAGLLYLAYSALAPFVSS